MHGFVQDPPLSVAWSTYYFQGDNPAFTEPLDIAKLRSKVSSLEDGANPVAEFLSTDYTSVKPKVSQCRV